VHASPCSAAPAQRPGGHAARPARRRYIDVLLRKRGPAQSWGARGAEAPAPDGGAAAGSAVAAAGAGGGGGARRAAALAAGRGPEPPDSDDASERDLYFSDGSA